MENLTLGTLSVIKEAISIGFCQPKFYKPSVWAKSKKIMEELCKMDCGVIPFDYGRGKGKYSTNKEISIDELALLYYNKLIIDEFKTN